MRVGGGRVLKGCPDRKAYCCNCSCLYLRLEEEEEEESSIAVDLRLLFLTCIIFCNIGHAHCQNNAAPVIMIFCLL